jgi:arylsulfatase A-like enzyme
MFAKVQKTIMEGSFWNLFRIIFVLFSFYLVGDILYRWNGVRLFATFYDFVPSIALITILWSIVALLATLILWLIFKVADFLVRRAGFKVDAENILLATVIFVVLGAIAWISKRYIFGVGSTLLVKLMVLTIVIGLSICLTWLFRGKLSVIQHHIAIWVWLFGICFILSVPLVAYHTSFKDEEKTITRQFRKDSVSDKKKPNILLVTFDALAAPNMSLYGYERLTTPFISEWAKKATVFTRTVSSSSFTTPSSFSLISGKRVWTHRYFRVHDRVFKEEKETIISVLKDNGYINMLFSACDLVRVKPLGISESVHFTAKREELQNVVLFLPSIQRILDKYFSDNILFYDWLLKEDFILYKVLYRFFQNATMSEAAMVFSQFLSTLDSKSVEPYFAWLHLIPPHSPYVPPEPFMGMFNDSQDLRTIKSQNDFYNNPDDLNDDYLNDKRRVKICHDRYDESIRYVDKLFEDFISQLEKKNKLENTIIILSADHGEIFRSDFIAHGSLHLYKEEINIPLIIKMPGQSDASIAHDIVEQIDISATILDLAEIPIPAWMEGRSLLPLIHGNRLTSKPALSMRLIASPKIGEINKGTIAVWEGDFKLNYYLEKDEVVLFNLREDPEEIDDIFNKEPGTGQRLLNIIQQGLNKANSKWDENSK